MWCGMMSSSSPIIRPDSTRVWAMWSIVSQAQTLASFVRPVCLIKLWRINRPKKKKISHSKIIMNEATACAAHGFYQSHTFDIHSRHVPAHAHRNARTRTHTLTTYCLASKAYVGRPRVLFMSSLWQMSERGDCCCGGCQREYSFVNENSEKQQLTS